MIVLTIYLALSSSLTTQLMSVLNTLDSALKLISTTFPSDSSKKFDYSLIVFDGFDELIQTLDNATGDEKKKGTALINILLKWVVETNQVFIF